MFTTTTPRLARFVPSYTATDPEPSTNPPPYRYTITGRRSLDDFAVLHERLGPRKPRVILDLKTGIAKMIGFADAGPARDRLRSAPSQITDGWSGEGDALVGCHALRIGYAGNGAVFRANHVGFCSRKERNCCGDGCYDCNYPE